MPTVSVVIAAHNPGPYLIQAIDSVRAQSYTAWTLTVVDDGSSEDLRWVERQGDPRITLVRQLNAGVSAARNRGISLSDEPLVAFLDQDDMWRPHKLARQVEAIGNSHPFCYTAFDLINEEGERLGPGYGAATTYIDMLEGRLGVLLSSVLVRRSAVQTAWFDPSLKIQQDLDLFIRLARVASGAFVESVEVDYRLHSVNASRDYWSGIQEILRLYRREAQGPSSSPVRRSLRLGRRGVRRTYAFQAVDCARDAARARRLAALARHTIRAFEISPSVAMHSARKWIRDT